jgi:hypothetical protein
MPESSNRGTRVRVPPPEEVTDTARIALRQLIAYQRGRQRIGRTILRARAVNREAHLLTLDDGEHLMILILEKELCYWEGSREPIEQLHARVCDWLTEPVPADAS